jgi:hypothetical protein
MADKEATRPGAMPREEEAADEDMDAADDLEQEQEQPFGGCFLDPNTPRVAAADLEVTLRVLQHLSENREEYQHPAMKPLRKVMRAFLDLEGARSFGGLSVEESKNRRAK